MGVPRARKLRKDMPEPERVLWYRLRAHAIGVQFRRQHPLGPYVLDFCAPSVKLVVELDGDSHYETLQARTRDAERDACLAAEGFKVLRFTNREVMENIEGVCAVIQEALQHSPSPLSPPSPCGHGEGGNRIGTLRAPPHSVGKGRANTESPHTSQIVLGLDPGFGRLGYGVIAVDGAKDVCVDVGCLTTPKGELGPRLVALRGQLQQLIARHQPERIVIEKLFFSKNVTTAIDVGQARGVILLTCTEAGAVIVEVSPQEVKLAVAGYGNADKRQVQQMVQALLKLPELPRPDDAADALAIALAGARVRIAKPA